MLPQHFIQHVLSGADEAVHRVRRADVCHLHLAAAVGHRYSRRIRREHQQFAFFLRGRSGLLLAERFHISCHPQIHRLQRIDRHLHSQQIDQRRRRVSISVPHEEPAGPVLEQVREFSLGQTQLLIHRSVLDLLLLSHGITRSADLKFTKHRHQSARSLPHPDQVRKVRPLDPLRSRLFNPLHQIIDCPLQQTAIHRHRLGKHPGLDLVQPTTVCQRLINRIHHPFQVLPSLDPSLQRQHHHDTSMRENGQTSPTPANVFSMEAFQSQINVH